MQPQRPARTPPASCGGAFYGAPYGAGCAGAGCADAGSRGADRPLDAVQRRWYAPRTVRHQAPTQHLHRGAICASAIVAALVLVTGCATRNEWSVYPDESHLDSLSAEQWQQDVEYLRSEVPKRNPHLRVDPQLGRRFDDAAASFRESIDEGTSADEVIVGIAQLLATIGEGHTSINASPTRIYPTTFHWFADGLYAVLVDRTHEELLGGRLIGIERPDGAFVDIAALEGMLNTCISAEHPGGYRVGHGRRLSDPRFMRGLGLADMSGLVVVVERDGRRFRRRMVEMPHREIDFAFVGDRRSKTPVPAVRNERNWWIRAGEDGEVVYVSYDECRLDAFGFFRSVLRETRLQQTERLIIDLRANSGGASFAGTWFARKLGRMKKLRAPGAVFVLVGPRTFSSGMMLAVDLMDKTEAMFAGQPLAESATSWGEVTRFPLPNSGIMIGTSTKLFRYARGKTLNVDEHGAIVPDPGFHIETSFHQYAAGIDPVYEAAVRFERGEG